MLRCLAASIALLAFALPARAEDAKWTAIEIDELSKAIDDGIAVMCDTNPKFVWEERRLPGAKWYEARKFEAKDLPAEKATMLVFYCMNEN